MEPLTGNVAEEIAQKISRWETNMSSMLSRFNEYSTFFRQIREPVKDRREGFSDTVTGEITRATRTLSTMMFRMLTSAQPNFWLVPLNEYTSWDSLQATETLLTWQHMRTQYYRYLLKSLNSMSLMGTVVVEEPWIQFPTRGAPIWEATGFYPRSLVQTAFDTSVPEMDASDYIAFIDFVTPARLRALAAGAPDVWDPEAIERAIAGSKDQNKIPQLVRDRRSKAGYTDATGNVLQLVTYYGVLDDNPRPDDLDWVVGVVNDTEIIRAHGLPFEHRLRPVRIAHFVEHELEPYGYGVGQFGGNLQKDLNANRRRMVNLATFALYHMWKTSRLAGIKTQQLRIRPYGVVETDDMGSPEPLRPDLNAFNLGKILDEMLKEELRANTGATANLQAIVTEATASESSIAQNEAVRNISVQAEIVADQLVRQHLYVSHKNNLQFLDAPLWLQISGEEKPRRVLPADLARDVEFFVKVTTDKDFRPERTRRLIEALQTITSVRNQLPPQAGEAVVPIVQEILSSLNVKMPRPAPAAPAATGNVLDQLAENIEAAQGMREQAVDAAAAAGNGVGGSPSSISVPDTGGIIETPVGPTLGSPM